jgi:glucokinase
VAEPAQFLVADVGGTNTRIAVGGADGMLRGESYKNDDVEDLAALMRETVLGLGEERPRLAVLAVAGPTDNEEIRLTNRPWTFSRAALRDALGLNELIVVNDFFAVAHALPALAKEELMSLGVQTASKEGNLLACGPGTGFGVSALVRSGTMPTAVSSEAGHMRLGAATVDEARVIGRLARDGAVAVEDVLSGRGLVAAHRILTGHDATTGTIIDAAKKGDAEARATVNFFMVVFGRVAGDLALAFDARAGVYIGGGLGQALAALYAGSPFEEAFRDHPPYQDRLAAIPVQVIMHPFPGLIGAQQIALARLRRPAT